MSEKEVAEGMSAYFPFPADRTYPLRFHGSV